jgi:hypothetical protein
MDRPAELSAVARVRVRRKDIDASFQIELPSFLASFASTFAFNIRTFGLFGEDASIYMK